MQLSILLTQKACFEHAYQFDGGTYQQACTCGYLALCPFCALCQIVQPADGQPAGRQADLWL